MSIKLSDLSKDLNISTKELRVKISDLGIEISPRARVVTPEIAENVKSSINSSKKVKEEKVSNVVLKSTDVLDEIDATIDNGNVVDIYAEMIGRDQDREIIKRQRKQTAGRGQKKTFKTEEKKVVKTKINGSIEVGESISVKEFSEKSGINFAKIIGELMKNGILANINHQIDFETLQIISDDLGVKIKRKMAASTAEDLIAGDMASLILDEDSADLKERPPVVCIMGHVDHGKTQLLDTIRKANVIADEAGGITQHIGAYQVHVHDKDITFLDTPGHEAFTSMRARGAKVTDIAIIVVAADEGVKPQTIEAINHAKDAEVPIIVAINKMDKPNANPEKVMGELTEHGLQPESWGGDTIMVPISALKNTGIDDLLDMILLAAEMESLKANPDRGAIATVIESNLDPNLGPVATVLVNSGTLKITNNIVVGSTYGKIKLMRDHNGKSIRIAKPSTPVFIAGLAQTPKSGDILQVVSDERIARKKAMEIKLLLDEADQNKMSAMNTVISQVKTDKILKIIVKADTKGSLEAIKQSIAKIKDDEVAVKVIHGDVGTVTKNDVMMASASNGIIMSFHTGYDSPYLAKLAERENVEFKDYKIIYDMLEDIKKILTGLIDAEIIQTVVGKAEVKQIFLTKKKDMIVGCRVLTGKMLNHAKLKVVRGRTAKDEDNFVGDGFIATLRKGADVVKEIGQGNECGIKYNGDILLEPGDILHVYIEEEKHRTIE